jgi:hypothetical protein
MARDIPRTTKTAVLAILAAACSQANPPPKTAQDCTEPRPAAVAAAPAPAHAPRHHMPGHFKRGPKHSLEHWDRNRDGRVEIAELPPGHRERWAAADTDRDGVLSKDELRAFHAQRALRHFDAADKNGDGALEAGEVDPRRWARLRTADGDGDGKVTRQELEMALNQGKLGWQPHGPPEGRGRHKRGAPRN